MKLNDPTEVPPSILEQRAVEERQRLHGTISELKEQVRDTIHEKLDVQRYASEHIWPAAGVAGMLSLAVGYAMARVLKRSA